MDSEQTNDQGANPISQQPQLDGLQTRVCEKCGQNPCVCPKEETQSNKVDSAGLEQTVTDMQDAQSQEQIAQDKQKPPKIRWI